MRSLYRLHFTRIDCGLLNQLLLRICVTQLYTKILHINVTECVLRAIVGLLCVYEPDVVEQVYYPGRVAKAGLSDARMGSGLGSICLPPL